MYYMYYGDTVSRVYGEDDITHIEKDDEVKVLEYDFDDGEVVQTLETKREAENLAGTIIEIMENGDWESHRSALSNLPLEYRQPSY